MGHSLTKSPLERRNTVIRRSQKRAVISTEQKIDKVLRDIRKFRGVSQYDEQFHALKTKIEEFKKDLIKKSEDLMPQVRDMHAKAVEKIKEAEILLNNKLKENIEKEERAAKRRAEKEGKTVEEIEAEKEKPPNVDNNNVNESGLDDTTIEELERQRDETASPVASVVSDTNDIPRTRRNILELNLEKIEHLEAIPEIEKSPQEKRKSVMKFGVQVLPSLKGEMNTTPNRQSLPHSASTSKTNSVISTASKDKFEEIKQQVQALEEDISIFVGKKNGIQYNRIKEKLFDNLDALMAYPDHDKNDDAYAQLKRYIDSCLSFLDEKATPDDEVFLPNNSNQVVLQNGFKITTI